MDGLTDTPDGTAARSQRRAAAPSRCGAALLQHPVPADAFEGEPNIYLANITPRTAVTGANEDKRRLYNTWLAGLPNGARDLFNFRDAVSTDDETLMPVNDADGTHMNASGYAAEAATITRPVTTPPVTYQTV